MESVSRSRALELSDKDKNLMDEEYGLREVELSDQDKNNLKDKDIKFKRKEGSVFPPKRRLIKRMFLDSFWAGLALPRRQISGKTFALNEGNEKFSFQQKIKKNTDFPRGELDQIDAVAKGPPALPRKKDRAPSIKASSSPLGKTLSDSVIVPQGRHGRLGDDCEGSSGVLTALTRNEQLSERRDVKIADESGEPRGSLDSNIENLRLEDALYFSDQSSSQLPNFTQVLPFSEPNKLQLWTIQSSDEDCRESVSSLDEDLSESVLSSVKDWTELPHLQMPLEPTDVFFHACIRELIGYGKVLFGISFPCTRTPSWFSQGSSKSSISTKLSPEDNRNSLEGIALSVVFENFDEDSQLKAIYCFLYIDECHLEDPLVFENFKHFGVGSFAFCCYIPKECFARQLTKSSRIIKASISTDRPNEELKMLGIHLIYSKDVEEFSKKLAQTANEHREVVLDFSRHCKQLLDSSTRPKSFGDDMISVLDEPCEKLTTPSELPHEAKQDGSGLTAQMRRDIQLALSRLFQGHYAQKNRFYFTVPRRFFSLWFFHQSIGDTTICYLPPSLYEEESWLGLELYVFCKRRPIILRSNLDSDRIPSLLHVDLYAHGDTTLPILTYPLLIHDTFFGSHFVFFHVPRGCFLKELNQCRGISALFRPSTSDLEVEMCGARLLYEHDSESFIQEIINSAQGREDAFDLLHHQIQMYHKNETRQRDEVEQKVPQFGLFSSFERERIEWLQKLLTGTEQVAEQVRTLLQNYRFHVARDRAYKEFDSVLLHSKHWFLDKKDHIHETSKKGTSGDLTSSFNHLHIMAETLIDLGSDLLYWKEDIEVMLKELFKNFVVTLSFKGQIVFDIKYFDSCSTFNLCFPQTEIPKWFKHQNSMSMLEIDDLPIDLYNDDDWRGLAICAALSVDDHNRDQILSLDMPFKILCHLKTLDFCLNPVPIYSITKEKLKCLDHGLVWLTYIPRSLLKELNEQSYVMVRIYSDFPGLIVKTCGIRRLYQKDVEEFKQTIIHCWTSFFDHLDSIYQFVVDKDDEKLPDPDDEESS